MNELLSNFDIIDICKELNIRLIKCGYKSDLVGKCLNGGYIINLDDAGGAGTHWTSLFVDGSNVCYYDSFGMIYPKEVERFCKGKNIIYNYNDIQYINDTHCGWYCIAFLHYFQNNNNSDMLLSDELNKFVNHFSSNPKVNLKRLVEYFKSIYRTK